MKLFLLAGLVVTAISPAICQTVTFAPQGAAILKNQTGQRIPGIQIVDVIACAPSAFTIPNGVIYQTAAANGLSVIGPSMGGALVNQRIALNWKHFLVQFLTDGALDAGVAGLSGVVSMPAGLVKGLVIGHAFMDKFSPQLLSTAPTPAALFSLMLDPSKSTQFTGAGCVEGAILAQYTKASGKAIGPVLIGASAPVTAAAPSHDEQESPAEAAYAWLSISELNTQRLQKIMAAKAAVAKYLEQGEF